MGAVDWILAPRLVRGVRNAARGAICATGDSQRFASLIMALGAVGMFLATVGYGIGAMAERPKPPRTDVELARVAP